MTSGPDEKASEIWWLSLIPLDPLSFVIRYLSFIMNCSNSNGHNILHNWSICICPLYLSFTIMFLMGNYLRQSNSGRLNS